MWTHQSEQIVTDVLASLLSNVKQNIEYKELLSKIPHYLHCQFMNETYLKFGTMHTEHDQVSRTGMQEEYVTDMNCLIKDSLMPKGVERQSQEQFDTVSLDINASMRQPKKGLNGTRSTFKNKSQMNATQKTSNLSVSSTRRRKKQINENLISIFPKDEPDPEIEGLWKKKNRQFEDIESEKREAAQKLRLFRQKKQIFDQELAEKPYTFDFEGTALNYTQNEDKINHHAMRARFAQVERRMKDNLNLNSQNLASDIKVKRKPSLKFELDPKSAEFNLNIPVFETEVGDPAALFGLQTEVGKYRLKDYRKHYGGRFNRLQKSLNTIDIMSEKPDEFNKIFSGQRHFKDQQSLNQSMISYRSRENSPTRRKLALPKLKGRYSTLDRYQK